VIPAKRRQAAKSLIIDSDAPTTKLGNGAAEMAAVEESDASCHELSRD
jgi:hypothetical protein